MQKFQLHLLAVLLMCATSAVALPLPAGFAITQSISGRALPTGVYFAHDGRVFVTEKDGRIFVYQNLLDSAPPLLVDLSGLVHTVGDRGLLGFALDPRFPEHPFVYVAYTYNGGLFPGTDPVPWMPRWLDNCGDGPGQVPPRPAPTTPGGCIVGGRISRLTVSGSTAANEQVLIEDWYQFFPTHSIGTILFGEDGYLYVGGGDGASANWPDWGQGTGNPNWPDQRSPPLKGGALRSQGLEVESGYAIDPHDPPSEQHPKIWLNGTILRIDPASDLGAPGNPLAATGLTENARRVIAYGLRNPFRFTVRPGHPEIWIGDVGWNTWEEINRLPVPPASGPAPLFNFGWPCFEGPGHTSGYTGRDLCLTLYANGDTGGRTPRTRPWYSYLHGSGPGAGNGSDITGLAFYQGDSYPAAYRDSLFIADNSRAVIYNIPYVDDGNGGPLSPGDNNATPFVADQPAVQLATGPGGDLFFPDIYTGQIMRISYCNGCSNKAPSAAIALAGGYSGDGTARTIAFTAANSVDENPGDTLSYAWDLDGNGNFSDATGVSASGNYANIGAHVVAVRVTDNHGASDTARMVVTVVADMIFRNGFEPP